MTHLPPPPPPPGGGPPERARRRRAASEEQGSDSQDSSASEDGGPERTKRSWRSRLLELALWVAVAVLTAVALVYASDRWLPSNF